MIIIMANLTGLLPESALIEAARALRVLAHPDRLRLVELLLRRRYTVGQLAEQTGLAPNAVSQHLNHMRAAGLLDVARTGKLAHYTVIHPSAKNLLRCIQKHAAVDE